MTLSPRRRYSSPLALLVLLCLVALFRLETSSPSSSAVFLLTVQANAEADCDESAGTGTCSNPDVDVKTDGESDSTTTTTTTTGTASSTIVEEDPNCPSRELITRCAGKHLDTNHNQKLDRDELESAIAKLPWYARGILQILGSVDKMLKKCDVDGDGAIGMDYDMSNNGETCLATCFKRKAFRNSFFPDCE